MNRSGVVVDESGVYTVAVERDGDFQAVVVRSPR
jgi:hypothetical protein